VSGSGNSSVFQHAVSSARLPYGEHHPDLGVWASGCWIAYVPQARLLREGQQPVAALAIARQVAVLTLKYAANSLPDPGLLSRLGGFSINLSSCLNQLGDARLALQMAELARDVFKEASRVAPEGFGFDTELSNAWQRIGKPTGVSANTITLWQRFRESAATEKRVLQREPSNHAGRKALSNFTIAWFIMAPSEATYGVRPMRSRSVRNCGLATPQNSRGLPMISNDLPNGSTFAPRANSPRTIERKRAIISPKGWCSDSSRRPIVDWNSHMMGAG
jgi:hypothetical protein